MPLVKRQIEPRLLCQENATGAVRSELTGMTNHTLANVIRQLSTLSRLGEDLFAEIFRESQQFTQKAMNLQDRVNSLQHKITQLDPNIEEVSIDDILHRKHYCNTQQVDQQLISTDTRPLSLTQAYNKCERPPPLSILTPYRDDGKDAMKFYTDPTFFFELWMQEMFHREAAEHRDKASGGGRKKKKKFRSSPDKSMPEPTSRRDQWQRLKHGQEFADSIDGQMQAAELSMATMPNYRGEMQQPYDDQFGFSPQIEPYHGGQGQQQQHLPPHYYDNGGAHAAAAAGSGRTRPQEYYSQQQYGGGDGSLPPPPYSSYQQDQIQQQQQQLDSLHDGGLNSNQPHLHSGAPYQPYLQQQQFSQANGGPLQSRLDSGGDGGVMAGFENAEYSIPQKKSQHGHSSSRHQQQQQQHYGATRTVSSSQPHGSSGYQTSAVAMGASAAAAASSAAPASSVNGPTHLSSHSTTSTAAVVNTASSSSNPYYMTAAEQAHASAVSEHQIRQQQHQSHLLSQSHQQHQPQQHQLHYQQANHQAQAHATSSHYAPGHVSAGHVTAAPGQTRYEPEGSSTSNVNSAASLVSTADVNQQQQQQHIQHTLAGSGVNEEDYKGLADAEKFLQEFYMSYNNTAASNGGAALTTPSDPYYRHSNAATSVNTSTAGGGQIYSGGKVGDGGMSGGRSDVPEQVVVQNQQKHVSIAHQQQHFPHNSYQAPSHQNHESHDLHQLQQQQQGYHQQHLQHSQSLRDTTPPHQHQQAHQQQQQHYYQDDIPPPPPPALLPQHGPSIGGGGGGHYYQHMNDVGHHNDDRFSNYGLGGAPVPAQHHYHSGMVAGPPQQQQLTIDVSGGLGPSLGSGAGGLGSRDSDEILPPPPPPLDSAAAASGMGGVDILSRYQHQPQPHDMMRAKEELLSQKLSTTNIGPPPGATNYHPYQQQQQPNGHVHQFSVDSSHSGASSHSNSSAITQVEVPLIAPSGSGVGEGGRKSSANSSFRSGTTPAVHGVKHNELLAAIRSGIKLRKVDSDDSNKKSGGGRARGGPTASHIKSLRSASISSGPGRTPPVTSSMSLDQSGGGGEGRGRFNSRHGSIASNNSLRLTNGGQRPYLDVQSIMDKAFEMRRQALEGNSDSDDDNEDGAGGGGSRGAGSDGGAGWSSEEET